MKQKLFFLAILITLSLLLASFLPMTGITSAQTQVPDCPAWTQWYGTYPIGSNVIMIMGTGTNNTYQTQIKNAANILNDALSEEGIGVGFVSPPASTSSGATVTFEVGPIGATESGANPVAKIMSTTYNNNGQLIGAVIRFDPSKQLHNSQGQLVKVLDNPTNIMKTTLHELGHTLGLGHHPFNSSLPCGGQTTLSIMNAMCSADAVNMPVTLTECDKRSLQVSYFGNPTNAPTPVPGEPMTDSFNKADNPSSLGTLETGQSWQTYGVLGIELNRARVFSFGSVPRSGLAWIEGGSSDGIVEITFSVWNNYQMLVFRLIDQNNYLAIVWDGGNGYRLVKCEAGVFATLRTYTGWVTNGDNLKVVMNGSVIDFYLNGTPRGLTVVVFNQSATKHGFGSTFNIGMRWDNFSFTPFEWDS